MLAAGQDYEPAQNGLDMLYETIGPTAEEFAFASGAIAHERGDFPSR